MNTKNKETTTAPEQEPQLEAMEEAEEEVTAANETSVEELITQITSSAGSEAETTTTIDVDTALIYKINTNLMATNGILLAFGVIAFLIIIYKNLST